MGMDYTPGRYVCKCLEQGLGESKAGKSQIVLKIQVLQRISLDPETGEENLVDEIHQLEKYVYETISPESEKAMEMLMLKLRHAGFTGSRFEDMNFVDSHIRCECQENDYDGTVTDRWRLLLPPKSVQPIDNQGAKQLNALFDRQLKGGKPPSNAKTESKLSSSSANSSSPRETVPINDDEVPF